MANIFKDHRKKMERKEIIKKIRNKAKKKKKSNNNKGE